MVAKFFFSTLKYIKNSFVTLFNKSVLFFKKYFWVSLIVSSAIYALWLTWRIKYGFDGMPPVPKQDLDNITRAIRRCNENIDTMQFYNCFTSSGTYDLYSLDYTRLTSLANRINANPHFPSLIRPDEKRIIQQSLNYNYNLHEEYNNLCKDKIYVATALYVCFIVFNLLSKLESQNILI